MSAPRDQTTGVSAAELTAVLEQFIRKFIRLPWVQRLSFTPLSALHTLAGRGPQRLTTLAAMTQIVTRLEHEGLVGLDQRRDHEERS
ncbi:hypothetical protein BKM31_12995 [[Actinomadura] parvosata subsp. kistnae]|uniref:Uncharacterized protein n=2 Tax=Nonomuraea TaxID=83681 RepID=A0A1U9ZWB5_9ACTN|nr:hypothetical protein BKM31_12995 [Nonomuraea sp. ATCC 55076]